MATAATWEARVGEWRASKETATQFCATRGLNAGTFRYWTYQVTKRAKEKSATKPPMKFAKIAREKTSAPRTKEVATGEAVVIEVGPARVVVKRGFDASVLSSVLEVLGVRRGDGR